MRSDDNASGSDQPIASDVAPQTDEAGADLRGEVLVAILNNKTDFGLLRDQGWYRIPVAKAPKRWPPKHLAFYQTKVFDKEAYSVRYYGEVERIDVVRRRDLFPNEIDTAKSERKYYRLRLGNLDVLPEPILSRRWRRIVFIPTTWAKFRQAVEINDLYDESPLEDRLWTELKRLDIDAERQYRIDAGSQIYMLDFAVFCRKGHIDVETDGDTWHSQSDRVARDNERNNALGAAGWQVLRFNTPQIRETTASYCLSTITDTINRLGGLSGEGLVSRVFYSLSEGSAQQLSLLETPPAEYTVEAEEESIE